MPTKRIMRPDGRIATPSPATDQTGAAGNRISLRSLHNLESSGRPIAWPGFDLDALWLVALQLGWPAKRLRMTQPAIGWPRDLAGDTPVIVRALGVAMAAPAHR